MSKIDEFGKILDKMTRGEKAELLKWIVRDLGDAFPGIDSTPGVCVIKGRFFGEKVV